MRGYPRENAAPDAKAGLNVALFAFPQGIAYAAIAGLPIQYGIYGSAIAAVVGPLFSGSRFIILGPTNATSVLLFGAFLSLGVTEETKVAMLPLAILMAGVFLILGALLGAASLTQFISRSVVTGYLTAAAFYIILNQIRKVLGFDFEIPRGSAFLDVAWLTIQNLPASQWPSITLGLLTGGTYFLMNRFWKTLPNVAITLVLMSIAAVGINALLEHFPETGKPLQLLYSIDASTWNLTIPRFNGEWIGLLANTALVIAFLSLLEGMSIGKSLAAQAGERFNSAQEMYGIGIANLACAFGSGMPASGSLTRSQLNAESGAHSAMASVIAGLLCAVGAFVFGPFIGYVPVCVLAVLVITIGLSLINRHVLRVVLKSTESDAIVFVVTFGLALLVRLDFAVLVGAGTSIILFLRKAAIPELVEYSPGEAGSLSPLAKGGERSAPSISIVHVEGDLFFGAADLFRDQLRRTAEDPNLKVVVLKMRNAHHLDATSVLALEELTNYLNSRERYLIVSEARIDAIRIFKRAGLIDVIGRDFIFMDDPKNPTISTAKALRFAQKKLNLQDAQINIFLGTQKRKKKEDDGET